MSGSPPRANPPVPERFARFLARGELVHLTGLQALARLPLEQIRRDRESGLRVGGFVSGYPGSPLAGFDRVLNGLAPLLDEHGLHFQLGLNEELAAAAVGGSQLIDLFPHERFDGVIGMWFGKAPGIDRCLDVLRHSNFTGISRFGGAVAVAGDDPACKSSSLPSQSEHAFAHAMIPLLVPSSASEVIELGLHAYALSRYAGLWTGLKLVADVCDGGELLRPPESGWPAPVLPHFTPRGAEGEAEAPFRKRLDPGLLPPRVIEIERDLVFRRLEAVSQYLRANSLDRDLFPRDGDRIGFVACGKHVRDLAAAFAHLGLDEAGCARLGIRVRKLAVAYPVEARGLREFARGLETVIVLDDRRDFLEQQVRSALYELPGHPRVLGQHDERGAPWLSARGALHSEGLAISLGPALARLTGEAALGERAQQLAEQGRATGPTLAKRRPHFCSGCPHLTSTRVPDGLAAAGGIGCHTMVLLTGGEMRFHGAMGSEGAPWIGLSKFVDTPHLLQNLGDGTYFHSGRQAIRACVAADVPITFKLLYNGAIAMTGGQTATGQKPLAPVIADLLSDGVQRVVACSEDAEVVALARREPRLELIARGAIEDAQRSLAAEPGVSVFVYDELCANERQRRQRRGLLPAPKRRVYINQDLCEGCGDCGRKSDCLSVHPVDTTLGRKTRIHQGSCSQDEACTQGDCPAFFHLEGDVAFEPICELESLGTAVREPALPELGDEYNVLMIGIGSTGVVSVGALLVDAARRDGLFAAHIDQTGLSQRGGRVVSHLRISRSQIQTSATVPWGGADTLLAFDALSAVDPQGLAYLSSLRTRGVLHESMTPTADMVSDPDAARPELDELRGRLATRVKSLCGLPAEEICTAVLGSHLPANVVLLGFAFQHEALPLSRESLEAAIRDGVAGETNLAAFRLGRRLAAHPERVAPLLAEAMPPSIGQEGSSEDARALYGERWMQVEDMLRAVEKDEVFLSTLAGFAVDLAAYQNLATGLHYLDIVLSVLRAELSQHAVNLQLTPVAARELYRLTAYKDEYEVARLALKGPYRRWLAGRTRGRAKPVAWLHPPALRALGLSRKLRLGASFTPLLRGLAALKGLRTTAFDPFGRARVRRVERELVCWYETLLARIAHDIERIGLGRGASIAAEAAAIRGYEDLKLERAAATRERVAKRLEALDEG